MSLGWHVSIPLEPFVGVTVAEYADAASTSLRLWADQHAGRPEITALEAIREAAVSGGILLSHHHHGNRWRVDLHGHVDDGDGGEPTTIGVTIRHVKEVTPA